MRACVFAASFDLRTGKKFRYARDIDLLPYYLQCWECFFNETIFSSHVEVECLYKGYYV